MSRDVCIKRNSYCPICKGVVMADCWHDSSQFSGGEVVRDLELKLAAANAELAEIKRQAGDSTEFVLAQINTDLRAELATEREAREKAEKENADLRIANNILSNGVTDLRAKVAELEKDVKLYNRLELDLLKISEGWEQHPDGWDWPCSCALCLSYN